MVQQLELYRTLMEIKLLLLVIHNQTLALTRDQQHQLLLPHTQLQPHKHQLIIMVLLLLHLIQTVVHQDLAL